MRLYLRNQKIAKDRLKWKITPALLSDIGKTLNCLNVKVA